MSNFNNRFRMPQRSPTLESLEDAFNEGREAAKQGQSIGMCPYGGEQYLDERMEWLKGYESEDKTR